MRMFQRSQKMAFSFCEAFSNHNTCWLSTETSDTSGTESLTDLVANTSGKAGQSGGGEVGK